MSSKKKVVIIGLPLFARRVQEGLKKVDSFNKYIVLNTYYSWKDKIRMPFEILTADVVYSINGTIGKSKVLDLAFALNKQVVMHWVGSDVLTAKERFHDGDFNKKYFNAIHFTDAPWLKNELHEIGIVAKVQYISGYASTQKIASFPERFKVLSYIPQIRSIFYGLDIIVELARKMPQIDFHVVGSDHKVVDFPENLIFHGWVRNIGKYIEESTVVIRFVEHDGLSQFVLEALSKGRYVLYNNDLDAVIHVTDIKSMQNKLAELKELNDKNELAINKRGVDLIRNEFDERRVMLDLKNQLFR